MAKLRVYDPPMCCSSGVCGPDADDTLAQFAAALDWARKNGIEVERFDLGHQPDAFATDATVKGLLETDGMDCLPLVIVDDEVFVKGGYPSREALGGKLDLSPDAAAGTTSGATACCSGADAA